MPLKHCFLRAEYSSYLELTPPPPPPPNVFALSPHNPSVCLTIRKNDNTTLTLRPWLPVSPTVPSAPGSP